VNELMPMHQKPIVAAMIIGNHTDSSPMSHNILTV